MKGPLPKVIDDERDHVQTRMLSLLAGAGGVKTLDCPRVTGKGTSARSRWWAFRCRRASRGRIASQSWVLRCWMDATAGPHHVRAHLGAGDQPGRALQAGARNAAVWVTSLDKGQTGGGRQVRVRTAGGANWRRPSPTPRAWP